MPIAIDVENQIVWQDGKQKVLEPRVFELLVAMAKRNGMPVHKERLMGSIWDAEKSESAVYNSIYKMRKTLGKGVVKTRNGIGYVLEGEVCIY